MMQTLTRHAPGTIRCDGEGCGSPALRVVGQTVIIEHKHHGATHTTVLTLEQLLDKMGAASVR